MSAFPDGTFDPSAGMLVSGIALTVADAGGESADGRMLRVADHLAAWLIAEWEREQQEMQLQVTDQT